MSTVETETNPGCLCREAPEQGPAHSGHERWCPATEPTPQRINEIRLGTGEELTRDELAWLAGAASRHELHVTGARGGHWPLKDTADGMLLMAQYLAASLAVIARHLPEDAEPGDTATTAGKVRPSASLGRALATRIRRLLNRMQEDPGAEWGAAEVAALYRGWNTTRPDRKSRQDLSDLERLGFLRIVPGSDEADRRRYRLNKLPGGEA